MSKRFTATEIWNDPWFRKLTPDQKCFWNYLKDNCDNAGVWKVDWDHASFYIGSKITSEIIPFINQEKERVRFFDNDNLIQILGFIEFQIGNLENEKLTNLQKNCLSLIAKYIETKGLSKDYFIVTPCLPVVNGYRYKGKGKDKGKEEDCKGETKEIMDYFNEVCKKKLLLSKERKEIINKRLKTFTPEQIKTAILNFSKDDWEDRYKFCDINYAIGIIKKIDNLEKWLNSKLKGQPVKEYL